MAESLFSPPRKGTSQFYVERVPPSSVVWENETTLVLYEFNSREKPLLRAWDKGIQCRPVPKAPQSPHLPWKDLPLEISFPQRLSSPFEKMFECRTDHLRIPLRVVFQVRNGFDEVKMVGRSTLDSSILATPGNQLIQMGPRGNLLFFRNKQNTYFQDFKPHYVGGKKYFSYFLNERVNPGVNSEGPRVILDENFKIIEKTDFLTDCHEFHYLGPRHYLYSVYETVDLPDGSCFLNQRAIEKKEGKILRDFSIKDSYLDKGFKVGQNLSILFHGRQCRVVSHLNSVQVIDENSWVISLGPGIVVKWNFRAQKPDWIFGGDQDQFDLKDVVRLEFIHTADWREGPHRLMVYDNNLVGKKSRILVFKLDVGSRKILGFQETSLGEVFSEYGGSVEERDSVYSVGTGGRDRDYWDFMELKDQKVHFSIRFGKDKKESYSYRIYRSNI